MRGTYEDRCEALRLALTAQRVPWYRVVHRTSLSMGQHEAVAKLKTLRGRGQAHYDKRGGWCKP